MSKFKSRATIVASENRRWAFFHRHSAHACVPFRQTLVRFPDTSMLIGKSATANVQLASYAATVTKRANTPRNRESHPLLLSNGNTKVFKPKLQTNMIFWAFCVLPRKEMRSRFWRIYARLTTSRVLSTKLETLWKMWKNLSAKRPQICRLFKLLISIWSIPIYRLLLA